MGEPTLPMGQWPNEIVLERFSRWLEDVEEAQQRLRPSLDMDAPGLFDRLVAGDALALLPLQSWAFERFQSNRIPPEVMPERPGLPPYSLRPDADRLGEWFQHSLAATCGLVLRSAVPGSAFDLLPIKNNRQLKGRRADNRPYLIGAERIPGDPLSMAAYHMRPARPPGTNGHLSSMFHRHVGAFFRAHARSGGNLPDLLQIIPLQPRPSDQSKLIGTVVVPDDPAALIGDNWDIAIERLEQHANVAWAEVRDENVLAFAVPERMLSVAAVRASVIPAIVAALWDAATAPQG